MNTRTIRSGIMGKIQIKVSPMRRSSTRNARETTADSAGRLRCLFLDAGLGPQRSKCKTTSEF